MDFFWFIIDGLRTVLSLLGFDLLLGGTGFGGFLGYEAVRVYKRGGARNALKGINWWYIPLFIINALLAAFIASVSGVTSLVVAFWLGFSVPSATGIFLARKRKRGRNDSMPIDDMQVKELDRPSFRDAVANYYSGAVW